MRVAYFYAFHGQVGLYSDAFGDEMPDRGSQTTVEGQAVQSLDDLLDADLLGLESGAVLDVGHT